MHFVELPWPPKELNPNKRLHWAVRSKHAKSYRAMCYALAKQANLSVDGFTTVHVFIDFYPPDKRKRDDDNLISAFKAGRDGLADALGIDDKHFRIHPFLRDEIVKNGKVMIRLTNRLSDYE